jgi:hypothetical protein
MNQLEEFICAAQNLYLEGMSMSWNKMTFAQKDMAKEFLDELPDFHKNSLKSGIYTIDKSLYKEIYNEPEGLSPYEDMERFGTAALEKILSDMSSEEQSADIFDSILKKLLPPNSINNRNKILSKIKKIDTQTHDKIKAKIPKEEKTKTQISNTKSEKTEFYKTKAKSLGVYYRELKENYISKELIELLVLSESKKIDKEKEDT